MCQKAGGSKARKLTSFKSVGLKPSILTEVYACGCVELLGLKGLLNVTHHGQHV